MTAQINALLISADDPCARLERKAPGHEPFELGLALDLAQAAYGQESPILLSLLIASLRTHQRLLDWSRAPHRHGDYYNVALDQAWGVARTNEHAYAPLNLKFSPPRLCCRLEGERVVLSFEDERGRVGSSQLDGLYQTAFGLGMARVGAELRWFNPDHGELGWVTHILAPLERWEQLAPQIEGLIFGSEIVSFDHERRRWRSGELLELTCRMLEWPEGDVQSWIDL